MTKSAAAPAAAFAVAAVAFDAAAAHMGSHLDTAASIAVATAAALHAVAPTPDRLYKCNPLNSHS